MERGLLLQHLSEDVDAIAAVLSTDPGAPVRHCPGWDVAELVRHHGDVHRWVTDIVRTGEPAEDGHVGPEDPAALQDWYRAGADALLEVLRGTDPDRACWTFGRPPAVAGFWTRRQALEAAIHRWDAELALGQPAPIDPALCEAGVEEVVDDLHPRQVALERTPAPTGPVELHATDLDRRWSLRGAGAAGAVSVAAPVEVLLLLLWRRVDLDDGRVEVAGATERRTELTGTLFAP